jgi:hypothetical protein
MSYDDLTKQMNAQIATANGLQAKELAAFNAMLAGLKVGAVTP